MAKWSLGSNLVTRVADGLYRVRTSRASCFLALDGGLALIDTGPPGSAPLMS